MVEKKIVLFSGFRFLLFSAIEQLQYFLSVRGLVIYIHDKNEAQKTAKSKIN